MKIVINRCYGVFSLSKEAKADLGVFDEDEVTRTDANLIFILEVEGTDYVSGRYSELKVVEIPDEATDWEIQDYDGFEMIIYVLDGKLYHAF